MSNTTKEIARNLSGRPTMSDSEKRNKVIKISCTKSEYEFFKDQAKKADYKQTARFIHDATIETISAGNFSYVEQSFARNSLPSGFYASILKAFIKILIKMLKKTKTHKYRG